MAAPLPADYEARTTLVCDLKPGERGNAELSALYVAADGTCWLWPHAELHMPYRFPYRLRVERHRDGVHVWLPWGETWERSTEHHDLTELVPVAKLHLRPGPG